MNAHDRLQHLIEQEYGRLRADVPSDREAAIVALLRSRERNGISSPGDLAPDLVTGRVLPGLGVGIALQLCLEIEPAARGPESLDGRGRLAAWAEAFLRRCVDLARARIVLGHSETGFMRIAEREDGGLDAWIASTLPPVSWRERADIDSWASLLARSVTAAGAGERIDRMGFQLAYPDDAILCGVPVSTWRDVVRLLIDRVISDTAQPPVCRWESLAGDVAQSLGIDVSLAGTCLDALTLDAGNASWHAAVAGVAPAPLVRLDGDRVALSHFGLTTEPMFFLTRELRRRDAQAYHNAAAHREDGFRQDVYRLFSDRRFACSAGRIVLRRGDGKVRTDIDAAVFDRKTGALGIFELKSQDPFARSTAELTRQRDNFLYANRQVAGVLDWLNRYGADEVLNRIDRQTAKRFRVRKVQPFVLGRYLAHFDDGPAPDRRAAWGTWPQVLRLTDGEPFGSKETNPIATLAAGLAGSPPAIAVPASGAPVTVRLGPGHLTVYASWNAARAAIATA